MIDIDAKSSDPVDSQLLIRELISRDICFDIVGMTMRHAGMMDGDPGQAFWRVF